MGKLIDLTGQKFGRWTVIKRAPNRGNRTFWTCQCQCGNIKDVASIVLRKGESQSCGCLNNELCAELGRSKIKDIKGKRFGRLVVIEKSEHRSPQGNVMWTCQCDCGEIVTIRSTSLISGNTKSCGKCCHVSHGEQKIINLLQSNNINFEYQKTFDSCRFPTSNLLAKFDFYIDNRYLLEYDGEQHFIDKINIFKDPLEKVQQRDQFKNNWCKENNIPLIRIPYTKLETLVFDDIWIPPEQKNV